MKAFILKAFLLLLLCSVPSRTHVSAADAYKEDDNTCSNPKHTKNLEMCSDVFHVTYVAAVFEYEAYNQWSEEGKGFAILRRNAIVYVKEAAQAKNQSADILVTPEYGLQSDEMLHYSNTEDFLTFTQYVPDPCMKVIPCDSEVESSYFEVMKILSCGARSNDIYLIVNVPEFYPCSDETASKAPWKISPSNDCPELGYFIYNTLVVFDRRGAIIARYRKIHLFLEDGFTPGPSDDSTAIFLTDFNVAFSLQTCFDIMYENPGYSNIKNYGIRDVAMSTAWVDQLPFELGDAIQNGWSRGLNSNLLASGYHNPENYELGSGIYRGYMEELPVYTFDKDSKNVLLVASVTTVAASDIIHAFLQKRCSQSCKAAKGLDPANDPDLPKEELDDENRSHSILHQNLSDFTRVALQKNQHGKVFNVTACSNDDFCCDLSYEYSGNLTYYFIVFSGLSPVGGGSYNLGVQQCGVVWCKTSDFSTCAFVELGLPGSDSFGPFKISSSNMRSDVVFPIGNKRDLCLINNNDLEFKINKTFYSITANVLIENLLTVALYGRWFIKDT